MRSIFYLLIILLIPLLSFSQNPDKINLKNKTTITCTITEVNKDLVLYRIDKGNENYENAKVVFNDILSIETDNKLLLKEFNDIKAEYDVPASEDVKKAMLLIGGGAGLAVLGVFTAVVISNIEPIRTHKRGQVSSTGIAMATAGVGLGVIGYFQLKKAKEKITK